MFHGNSQKGKRLGKKKRGKRGGPPQSGHCFQKGNNCPFFFAKQKGKKKNHTLGSRVMGESGAIL